MKRDMDLIRTLLLKVEALPVNQYRSGEHIPGYTPAEVFYHVEQMQKSRLIEASLFDHDGFIIYDLTPEGHDFIAAAKSDTVWNKAKQTLKDNAGAWTLEALKTAMRVIMKHAAQGQL